jgi:hypothetical protein
MKTAVLSQASAVHVLQEAHLTIPLTMCIPSWVLWFVRVLVLQLVAGVYNAHTRALWHKEALCVSLI